MQPRPLFKLLVAQNPRPRWRCILPASKGAKRCVRRWLRPRVDEDVYENLPRARVLADRAPHFSPEQIEEALGAANTIREIDARTSALAALITYLAAEQRDHVLQEALAAARATADKDGLYIRHSGPIGAQFDSGTKN
jgi:hypothetical protein